MDVSGGVLGQTFSGEQSLVDCLSDSLLRGKLAAKLITGNCVVGVFPGRADSAAARPERNTSRQGYVLLQTHNRRRRRDQTIHLLLLVSEANTD